MLVSLSLCTFSCEDKNDSNDVIDSFDTLSVTAGNMMIINQLSEPILLYLADTVYKEIPGSSEFLVNISNPSGTSKELKIWKKSDIVDFLDPDASTIYRRWEVILPNNTSQDDRIVWIIKSGESGVFVGELTFDYPEVDETGVSIIYSVDVFINNKTGSKITALSPGTEGKKVGLEYGYYLMYYYFWYSDPNSTEGRVNIGWIESDVNGSGISTLINATNTSRNIDVPPFLNSNIGREGILNIVNANIIDVQIWVNGGTLIETIAISSLPTTGLSILESNGGTYSFLIPEESYRIEAKNMQSGQVLETLEDVYIMELHPYNWEVSTSNTYNNIQIINNSGEIITLHDGVSEQYLGHYINIGQTKNISINSEIPSLKAKSTNLLTEAFLAEISSTWEINSLRESFFLGFESNNFGEGDVLNSSDVTIRWDVGSSNDYSEIRLLNTSFIPYSQIVVTNENSYTFEKLDESPNGYPYKFQVNSFNNTLGLEYGWQDLNFYVDAFGQNSIRIKPWKQIIETADSSASKVFSIDVMLEEVDSLASAYIELEFDSDILNFELDSIQKGSMLDNCNSSLFLYNIDANEVGKLYLNYSFIGNGCGALVGSGQLATLSGTIIGFPEDNTAMISINNNSIFRDKDNLDIDISNLSESITFDSTIEF